MSFQDAVRTCIQQKYADFSGRGRRSEYWFFFLFNILLSIVATVINSILRLPSPGNSALLSWIVSLALLVPGLAAAVRRLHDTGRSGWWLLIGLVPCIGAIVLIVFMVQDSQPQPNQYGPSPKGGPAFGGPAPYGGYGMPPQQ